MTICVYIIRKRFNLRNRLKIFYHWGEEGIFFHPDVYKSLTEIWKHIQNSIKCF